MKLLAGLRIPHRGTVLDRIVRARRLRPWSVIVALPFALASSSLAAFAQTVNPSLWITDGQVFASVSDGSTLYLGGYFSRVGPVTGCAVAIDMGTGAVQQPYPKVAHPGVAGVLAVAPDGSGGWFLGGSFTSVRGVPRNNLAQLNAAGELTAWNPNANNAVTALAVVGGTVYTAGVFTSVGGQPRNRVAALDATTGSATAWDPDADAEIHDLVVSGGTVYVGGAFTGVGGQSRNRIAALDATTGLATPWNPDANSTVQALGVSGGTVYAGGKFTAIGGQTRNRLAALDAATGAATAWNPDAQSNYMIFPGVVQPAEITALAIDGSSIYAGGFFTSIGGQTRRDLAALDAGSGLATAWDPNLINTTSSHGVLSMGLSGGTVYAGGNFIGVGGQARNNIAAVDVTTGLATAWNPSMFGAVNAIAVSGSTVYAGGTFISAGTQPRVNIAAFDLATGAATAWNPTANDIVRVLAYSAGTVLAGGNFTSIGGQSRSGIAALDAATGAATPWNPNANGQVLALASSGGTVYAGGAFTTIGGQARNNLAALDATTGDATAWNPNVQWPGAVGPYASVQALAVGAGTIYVGGGFTRVGALTRNHLAAVDATTGLATAWNPNAQGLPGNPGIVFALARGGGWVYAAGNFTGIGGQPRAELAALDEATGVATAFNASPNGRVHALALSANVLYVGGGGPGFFTQIGGQPRSAIAALDATTGFANAWNPSTNNNVNDLMVSAGKVYASGVFTRMSGLPHQYIAAISAVDVPTATLLARFDAAPAPDGIELRWSFADAREVRAVDVERGRDAAGPWVTIAPERRDEAGTTVALDRSPGAVGEYLYRLVVRLADGDRMVFGPVSARYGETPSRNELTLLSPNPTAGGAQLHYGIARAGRVRIEVLDVSGRVVETLADGVQTPGRYVLAWDGAVRGGRPAIGLYFVRFATSDRMTVRRLAIVR